MNTIKVEQLQKAKQAVQALLEEGKPASTKKILLLDDEPYNIEVLKLIFKTLKLEGFPENLDYCFDAQSAL